MNDFNDSYVPAQPDNFPLKGLTPKEEAAAMERAQIGFEARLESEYRVDEIDINELAQTPTWIRRTIMLLLVSAPFLLIFIMAAGAVLTASKEYAVFSVYGWVVGASAVVVITGGLILSGFTQRLNRLRNGARARRVATLWSFIRAVGVRIGIVKPLDYGEMDDRTMNQLGGMLYFIALVVNVYGYILPTLNEFEAAQAAGDAFTLAYSQIASLAFGVILGAMMPRVLETSGEQLAEYGYQFFMETKHRMERMARDEMRQEFERRWTIEGEFLVKRELDRAWRAKNNISITASIDSPYQLTDGTQEDSSEADVPLVKSLPGQLPSVFNVPSQNGNGIH